MLLWIILIFIIIALAFFLALNSMRDFQNYIDTKGGDYGLFLVRDKSHLGVEFLDSVHNFLKKENYVFAFERLFKGSESALVVFGPRSFLMQHSSDLSLLELEDYASSKPQNIAVWEAGVKSKGESIFQVTDNIFHNLPTFLEDEKFWWQIILRPLSHKKEKLFNAQVRAVYSYTDPVRKDQLLDKLQNISNGILVKIPSAIPATQIFTNFVSRKFAYYRNSPVLNFDNLLKLVLIS